MRRHLFYSALAVIFATAIWTVPVTSEAARGGGTVGVGPGRFQFNKNPEDIARDKQKSALKDLEKGIRHEDRAAKQKSEDKRSKYDAKAREEYEKAVEKLKEAVEAKPDLHDVWKDLGFAYRKVGDLDGSLRAYDKALELKPGYWEALGARAESLLWMNRLDEAKQAYVYLFPRRRDLADRLMSAMHAWVKTRQHNPDGLDPGLLSDFAQWVTHRDELAQQTASVGQR